jgi:hypothetical protein
MGALKLRIQERLERLDWPKVAFACKWAARGRCQLCGRQFPHPFIGLEAHHNTYERLGHEHPSDLTALCAGCHAVFTWMQRNSSELETDSVRLLELLARLRVRLEDVDEFYREHVRELNAQLEEVEEHATRLLVMSEAGRQPRPWERKAA